MTAQNLSIQSVYAGGHYLGVLLLRGKLGGKHSTVARKASASPWPAHGEAGDHQIPIQKNTFAFRVQVSRSSDATASR